MALHHGLAVLVWTVACWFATVAGQPQHSLTRFDNLPARLFFFDDTPNAIYHDVIQGIVYVSPDEGKTWKPAENVPAGQAAMVIDHPFDNKVAFIISRGTKHWRTMNRGDTWQSFETKVPPALVGRPLSFHSDGQKWGHILFQGTSCDKSGGWGSRCHDETYYTKDGFSSEAKLLKEDTSRCQFAHSSKDFKHEAHSDLIYCVAYQSSSASGGHSLSSSRLFSSTDFFQSETKIEELGIGKNARGVVAFAIVSKFAVVAMKDLSEGSGGDMLLYATVDTKTWAKAQFPHSSSARLRENAYTIVESTTHSLAVDVLVHDMSAIGTLFVSNSNGTFFVESLKDTNRNEMGFVDYETIYGVEGVGLANIVRNAQEVESRRNTKQLQTKITFDDGRTWSRLLPPAEDIDRHRIDCKPEDESCSLHLHSVTLPHNFGRVFSSPAPGLIMGVGSIGEYLKPYGECDTFLSTDGGITWKMIRRDAQKYEFGDSGSILVTVNDEEGANSVSYSTDFGKTWNTYEFGIHMRARILTTVGDSTSQKFLLIGQIAREDQDKDGRRYAAVFLDFATLDRRKCKDDDFEKWIARSHTHECLMGHKQSYKRRRPDANCYVGEKFVDPVPQEEPCPCRDEDYECDYNFIRDGDKCVPAGPEPIPAGVCEERDHTYMGSSGFRKIPGNTCVSGDNPKDKQVQKSCKHAQPQEGSVIHRTSDFPSPIVQYSYFRESTVILVRLADDSIWQSPNEGYTWTQIRPEDKFIAFYHHRFAPDRAYLITKTRKFWYTTDTGKSWFALDGPTVPNSFGLPVLHFHPGRSDYLIWTGNEGCTGFGENCHVQTHYSLTNGRDWTEIGKYMRNCAWARDEELKVDPNQILCESYKNKQGNQRAFRLENPLELISGTNFFEKKTKLFDHVVGFAKFSEYLIVAEYLTQKETLDIQVSLDGRKFAPGEFPPTMRPDQHAYTILESSTMSVFLHVTTSEPPAPYWGNILKSNSNGTYFGLSIDNVNRNEAGYVDFEKMIGLDGIALINVVSNPHDAPLSKRKELQSRITHNDGGTWRPLVPPSKDLNGNSYACDSTKCALHIHGYTERYDVRATYSTPSVPGLLMAVGNVGESLAPYAESDTFLSRDAGFTWEEVRKSPHLWEFGDSGSILIMAYDDGPTDHVVFSTNEGTSWREYKFTDEPMHVKSIVTVPADTSRRFILLGYYPRAKNAAVAVHLDFSALTNTKCQLDVDQPNNDDFELWSPSENRDDICLFGRRTFYHRRRRDRNCIVGSQERAQVKTVENCQCKLTDFECEFNYARNAEGECVLLPGLQPRDPDPVAQCRNGEDYWYDLTPYRKIPFSSCEGGQRIDHGTKHPCPGLKGHGAFFWLMLLFIPTCFAGLAGYWYNKRGGYSRGAIRLPGGDTGLRYSSSSGVLDTLASVPWFILGLGAIAYEWIAEQVASVATQVQGRRGYRNLPVDEDAQILRFEDEE